MIFWDNDITTDRRPYVLEIQTYLRAWERNELGTTTVPQDGFFGSATTDGVRRFQQSVGLSDTGSVDRITWDALAHTYQEQQQTQAPPLAIDGLQQPILQPGDEGDAVTFLNIMLGLSGNVYTVDTEEHIREIQRTAFLPVSGNTDTPTWNAVARLYNQGGVRE